MAKAKRSSSVYLYLLLIVSFLFIASKSFADKPVQADGVKKNYTYILQYDVLHHPVYADKGMVVSQNRLASSIGRDILAQGGNAYDAAVAVGFALAVTLPRAGNLGGGGFVTGYVAKDDSLLSLDFRSQAPEKSTLDMYLDKHGEIDTKATRNSHISSGIPGTVAGLTYLANHHARLPLKTLIQPAIDLASRGIVISTDLSFALKAKMNVLHNNAEAKRVYYKEGGKPYERGELLIQPDLAWSLKQIAKHGKTAFYQGEIAKKIVASNKKYGGVMSATDLANYEVKVRKPLVATYRDYQVVTMGAPSSAGIPIIQMLKILENFPLKQMGHNSAQTLHIMAEAMRFGFVERTRHIGDPDFYPVPTPWLTSAKYGKQLADKIELDVTMTSAKVNPGVPVGPESPDTTHFSVADNEGNAVSITYTLSASFGSGIVMDGTGILMNNQMNNFSFYAGDKSKKGIRISPANTLGPGKRPMSAQAPSLILKDGKPYVVTGSPGGARIISAILQIIVNVIDHDMNIAEATHAPRIHQRWYPDRLEVEPGISLDTIELLKQRKHQIKHGASMGSTQSIMFTKDGLLAGSADPRRPGAAALGLDSSKK